MMNILNIAAYKFIQLSKPSLPPLQNQLKNKAIELGIKGTILLSTEGINLILAGEKQSVENYQSFLSEISEFNDLTYKKNFSTYQPFRRMLVRIKKEIISIGNPDINLKQQSAPYVTPDELHEWYKKGKNMVVLDTRNDYEVRLGRFENAIDLDIKTFRTFPEAISNLPNHLKEKTIVTYCTGGIRCEKATLVMREKGFKHVYQLEGGILNYFEKCGGDYYSGECFVFDKRVALDSNLNETETGMCYSCGEPVTIDYQVESELCPYCHQNRNGKRYIQTSSQKKNQSKKKTSI